MASIVYVSSSTTDVITEIASTSEVIISNLQGPQGATGPQGPQGTPGGIASVVAPITNTGTETAAIIGINASSANTANYVVQRDANKEFVAGAVTIDTTLTPTSAPGKLYWDGGGTVNLGLAGGNVSVALGENLVSYVTNAEATTLAVGEVVYVFGASGDRPSVKRASNASEITSSKTLGIVAESIGANQIGFVITRGIIGGLALGSYTEGAPVYLGSTAGTFTSTKPVAPANLVALGWVIRANNGNGQIYVNVQNGFELEELHNVLITSAANGNFLVYDSATTLWKNQAISATAPVTYNAGTRTIAANAASTSASGVVQLSDSTSTTSSVLAATPTAVKAAYDLATTANATANAAIPATQKAAANGVATLDASGLVPTNQLPALAITNTFVVNSQAAMLALTAQPGDVAIRTDLSESYILTADPASTLANWQELLSPPDAVTSVDGRVGAVTLTDKYAQLATANTFTGGVQQINTASATTNGLIVRASAGQSANLLEIQSDTGSVNYLINNGSTAATGVISVGSTLLATTFGAQAFILSNNSTRIGLVVRGASSQTGELQVWQNNSGTVLARVNASGIISSTEGIQSGSASFAGIAYNGISNPTGQTGLPSLIVKGITSQTANLQEWHSSAGLVSSMDTSGQLRTPTVLNRNSFNNSRIQIRDTGTLIDTGIATNVALTVQTTNASPTADYFQIQNSGGTVVLKLAASNSLVVQYGSITTGFSAALGQLTSVSSGAGTVGAVIRGAASATADLTQWQSSAGTVLTRVGSDGRILINGGSGFYAAAPTLGVITLGASTPGFIVRGAASQTANLAEFHDSNSNVVSSVSPTGTFVGNVQDSQLVQYGAEGSVLQNIPTRVHPAETLLKQAVWWIDSAHSGSSGQAIKNLGWGGSALDATAGSTTAADSNDPRYLDWSGVNYVYTPGVAGNYLRVNAADVAGITGDLDLRIQVAMDDWTPAASAALISRSFSTSLTNSYSFSVNATTGTLRLAYSADGTTIITKDSTVAPTITDGVPLWVRATLDVDNGASGNDVRFFTSNDGLTWTQLGTTITTAGAISLYPATSTNVMIGSTSDTAAPLSGKIYRAQILNGIDGVPILDVDNSIVSSGAAANFAALTGQNVLVTRSTSGRKTTVVTHPVWLFGTDDYMEVNNRWLERTTANYLYLPGVAGNNTSTPDSTALSITGDIDLRVKVALDDWTPAAANILISKGFNFSYELNVQPTGALQLLWSADGTTAISKNSTVATGITDGSVKWVRATLDVDNGASGNDVKFFTSDDGTTWTQLGTTVTTAGVTSIFDSSIDLRIGGGTSRSLYGQGKFFRAQVLNGIGGTVAFDANFETGITTNLPTTFTESSANAATVTINYSGTGYRSAGVIASTYVFPGNPNTFKLSSYSLLDFGASEDLTTFIVGRKWATKAAAIWMSKATGVNVGDRGYVIYDNASGNTSDRFGDGTNRVTPGDGTAYSTGGLITRSEVRNVASDNFTPYLNGTAGTAVTDTTTGSLASLTSTLLISPTTGPNDFEFVSAAIFRRALTAAEIATLNSYFQGRVA